MSALPNGWREQSMRWAVVCRFWVVEVEAKGIMWQALG